MKKTLLILVGAFCVNVMAQSLPKEKLICEVQNEFGSVSAVLDPRSFTPGSGYRDLVQSRIIYNFSAVSQMVCEGMVKGADINVNCVGYYSGREITEVLFRTENGIIMAHWQTNRAYGSVPMHTPCRLEAMQE
ncbi:MAG: hypothetical protein AB7F86_16855 [Bdellovibrionales bacterium]